MTEAERIAEMAALAVKMNKRTGVGIAETIRSGLYQAAWAKRSREKAQAEFDAYLGKLLAENAIGGD